MTLKIEPEVVGIVGYCDECFDPSWEGSWSGYAWFHGTREEIESAYEDHREEYHR